MEAPLNVFWKTPPYAFIYLLTIILALFSLAGAWRQREQIGGTIFIALMGAIIIWSAGVFVEHSIQNMELKILMAKVEYIGIVTLPVLWLLFAYSYERQRRLNLRDPRFWALWIIPITTLVLAWTNEAHGLIWTSIYPAPYSSDRLVYERGPWFWVMITYNYLCLLTGMVFILRAAQKSSQLYRRRTIALLAGVFIVMFGNILYLTGIVRGIDPTPLALAIATLIYVFTLFGTNLFDIVPLARTLIIENMDQAVLILNRDGRLVDFNPAAVNLLKARVLLHEGTSIEDIFAFMPALVGELETKQNAVIELGHDPLQQIEVHISPIRDRGEEVGKLILLRDVTRRLEEQAAAFGIAVEEERVNILGKFIRDAAHEFRTPLAVINTSLYLLSKTSVSPENGAQYTKISQQVQRMATLLDDMQLMMELDTGKQFHIQRIDLLDLLRGLVEIMQPLFGARHQQIRLELAPDLPLVDGDAAYLVRAFRDVLQNACLYTPDGGSITVHGEAQAGGVSIAIRDSGIGMSEEVQSHAFERFYRADTARTVPGFGLGLPIARRIIEQHSGTINIQSQVGVGTTVTIWLPSGEIQPSLQGENERVTLAVS